MSMDKKIKPSALLLEAILIIFAVLIGLVVNEWRENLGRKKKSDIVLENVMSEIKKDREDLSQAITMQEAFYDSLGRFVNFNRTNGISAKTFVDILIEIQAQPNITAISLSSWEAAQNSGVLELFDFKLLSSLSEINEAIIVINKISERMVDSIYHQDAFDTTKTEKIMQMFSFSMQILISAEKMLIEQYDAVLNENF